MHSRGVGKGSRNHLGWWDTLAFSKEKPTLICSASPYLSLVVISLPLLRIYVCWNQPWQRSESFRDRVTIELRNVAIFWLEEVALFWNR